MNNMVKVMDTRMLQERGTKALIKELGVVGMLRYLEKYDNGQNGDYTKEKYLADMLSIDEIADL